MLQPFPGMNEYRLSYLKGFFLGFYNISEPFILYMDENVSFKFRSVSPSLKAQS